MPSLPEPGGSAVEQHRSRSLRLFGTPATVRERSLRCPLHDRPRRSTHRTWHASIARATGKFSPAAVERLAALVDAAHAGRQSDRTCLASRGGVYVKAGRQSASRFFWSRPVVLEFARGRQATDPRTARAICERDTAGAVIALQKQDWGLAEDVPDSLDFFLTTPRLATWLDGRLRARATKTRCFASGGGADHDARAGSC